MPLNLDQMIYIVISDSRSGGLFINEVTLDQSRCAVVARDIRDGQYADIAAVLELNPVEHICRDATDEFRAVIDRRSDEP